MALDGGGSRFDNRGASSKWTPPVTANPKAKITFDSPVIRSTPAPAPYQAPYYPPVQQQPQTPSYGIGTPTGGGMGGSPAPAPQVKPVMSSGDWLKGDSTYQNQMSEYGSSLEDFLARLATQRSDFDADYKTSKDGLARNEQNGMQALGEDFTSRGMATSGLFDKSRQETQANYGRQGSALDSARTRATADFGNQERDKRTSTEKAKNNAKSASLGRMANDQMFS